LGMRKLFKLNLWPSEEEKKQKQLYNQQQKGGAFGVPPTTGGGGIVVDGVDNGCGEGGGRRLFGIRNYLHHFYFLSPSPTVEEIVVGGGMAGSPSGGQWYLLPPPPSQRMGLYICRLMSLLGLLLLLGGATAIVVGYTWPHYFNSDNSIEASLMRIAIDQDEEGNFYIPPERLSEILRDPMHGVKMAGFCVFAIGASMMALSLLVPTFAHCSHNSRLAAFASEDNTPNEPPVRIYPAAGMGGKFRVSPAKHTGGHKISPTGGPVPVMEEIAKVQPNGGKKSPSSPAYSPTADELLGTGIGNEPLLGRQ